MDYYRQGVIDTKNNIFNDIQNQNKTAYLKLLSH